MHRFTIILIPLFFSLLIFSSGCAPAEEKIIVAFVPSIESQTIIYQLDKFEEELAKGIGMKVKAEVMPSYMACVEAMGTGQIDVAFLPPMAYVLGHKRYGLEVLLKVERHGKTVYRGEIIVRKDSGIETIDDLKGKTFAFVESSSASGHLYAKALLLKHGIVVGEERDTVLFTLSHPSVVLAVVQGKVDAGACFDDARVQAQDIAPDVMELTKVLAYTDDIPADTVSVRDDFPEGLV